MANNGDPENNPPSGPPEVDDIWIGEERFAYDSLKEIDRLYDKFSQKMEDIEERSSKNNPVVVLKPEERTKFLEYYTVVYSHIERLAAIALFETIVNKSSRDQENGLDFFRDEFTQSKREDMLYWAGLIDSGLKGEMARVRKKRNDLTHNQQKRMYIDFSDASSSDVKRARDTVYKLEDVVEEQIGYCPECGKSPLLSIGAIESTEELEELAEMYDLEKQRLPTSDWINKQEYDTIGICPECYTAFQQNFGKVTFED